MIPPMSECIGIHVKAIQIIYVCMQILNGYKIKLDDSVVLVYI